MKRFFLFIILIPIVAIAQKKSNQKVSAENSQLTINGTIDGIQDNTIVSLLKNSVPVISDTVRNKKFYLTTKLDKPGLYELSFTGYTGKKAIFVGNDVIQFNGEAGKIGNAKVSGSLYHDDFEMLNATFAPIFQRMSSINQSAQMMGATDSLRRAYNNAKYDLDKAIDDFIEVKSASPVSALLLVIMNNNFQNDPRLEARFNILKPEALDNEFGENIKEVVAESKIGAVGTDAIDFTQNDVNGKPVNLSSFKGQYVLIDFWASWCGPCRQENPNVVAAFNKFKTKNFTVLGVSLDRAKENWLQAIADDKLTWTHVSDLKFWNNEVAQKYKISSIPQNFLVGPDGKIVAKNLRGEELHLELEKLLK